MLGRAVVVLSALVLLPHPAVSADPLTKAQNACITGLNAAGAKVAAAVAADLRRCVRDACRGGLPAGQTAEQCLRADSFGRVAKGRAQTAALFARKCAPPPPFGPTSATAVNDAFAALVRAHALFGGNLDNALLSTTIERAGAACQAAVATGMTRVALAKVRAFNECVAAGLRHGAVTSTADLRACEGIDPKGKVARTRTAAQSIASARCASVVVADAFPGACAAAPLAGLFDCLETHIECGACRALNGADGLLKSCHHFGADGVAQFYCGDPPATAQSVARQWDESMLSAIRVDNPRPPVHARNLFHVSVAMYDAWAAYDQTAKQYLTNESATSTDVERDRAIAISFAAYRVLAERYAAPLALNAAIAQANFLNRMEALGFDTSYTSTVDPTPAALGNRIAAAVIAFGLSDGSNEAGNYGDLTYHAVNQPLIVKIPDINFADIADINHWQPLALDQMIGQNGVPLPGKIQGFVGARWGGVTPFALTHVVPGDLYLDPGPQPQLGGTDDATFKAQVKEVIERSGQLTPDDGATMDIGLDAFGNNPLGTNDGTGYPVNPVTGQPYTSQVVKRGDFGRLIAEFWADGPSSETPPGHWNVIANNVADNPLFEKRFGGTGPVLGALEWDVKTYFAINAAAHDAAIACWGAKRVYDGVRPITMIRYMGKKGQSSDPTQPSYDPLGLPLEPGVIELITDASSAPGERHAALVTEAVGGHVGDIAIPAWPGPPPDPKTQHSGVTWILARGWNPYQRSTFVTPAFPGYYSGHSTYSRSAAEVLTAFTGSEYFPGGLEEFVVPQNGFLQFEQGPSQEVRLQWARYFDAADQAGQSRLWGGIHVQADDFTGRITGHAIGIAVFNKAKTYFDGTAP